MKCVLSNADVIATITILEEAIMNNIKLGRSVELGSTGILTPQIKSETRDEATVVSFKCNKEGNSPSTQECTLNGS